MTSVPGNMSTRLPVVNGSRGQKLTADAQTQESKKGHPVRVFAKFKTVCLRALDQEIYSIELLLIVNRIEYE